MKKFIFLSFFSFHLINNIHAQESCKVAADALQGTYTGECKDGKANGKGKAAGTDTYEGEFKNGYPDGNGTYTWANKDVYTGSFRKGALDGKGELSYFTRSGQDSVVKGFWKKNKYIGKYEKPYNVNDRSGKVNKAEISITRKGEKAGSININSTQLSGSMYAATPTIPVISDITVVEGQYLSKTTSNISQTGIVRLQQLIFPFRVRIMYSSGEMVDLTFNEQADYEVNVSLL